MTLRCEDFSSHVICSQLSTDTPQLSLSPSTVPASLPALSDLTASVQAHAYAPGTLRNLPSQWKSYLSFCSTFGLLLLPASPQTISSYAVFLACFTHSYQTILNKLNGLRLLHLLQNTPCTALDSFEVSSTKKGLKRMLGLATPQKSPITPALLLQFKSHLDITTPADAAIWCLFTVAFFSFLRKSNLTVSSPTSFDPNRHLCRDDIKFRHMAQSSASSGQRPSSTKTASFLFRCRISPAQLYAPSPPFCSTSPWFPPQIPRCSSALLLVAPCVL